MRKRPGPEAWEILMIAVITWALFLTLTGCSSTSGAPSIRERMDDIRQFGCPPGQIMQTERHSSFPSKYDRVYCVDMRSQIDRSLP